jgi:peptidoglycan/xylan/chitin deacetylase (PgdA/CDA1 family)
MRSIGFSFNFNIQRCEVEVGEEASIIKNGYWPLFEILVEHGIKSNFFLTGYSTEKIFEVDPSFISSLSRQLGNLIQLGSYTYTHPIPQLLTVQEMRRQIQRGLSVDRNILGINSRGFFPPEFSFTKDLARLLLDDSFEYIIVLSDLLARNNGKVGIEDCYKPYNILLDCERIIHAVPIALDLPNGGRRFFKRMLLGELSPKQAADDLFQFLNGVDDVFVVLERDAESLYVDELNSGVIGTKERLDQFLDIVVEKAHADGVSIVHIEEYLSANRIERTEVIEDYLGNTKIETFTQGPSKNIWEKTKIVRERLLNFEKAPLSEYEKKILEIAWNHMLLAHNSDGRIGYWHSNWKPGEHIVVQSRRDFVEDHLHKAEETMNLLEGR